MEKMKRTIATMGWYHWFVAAVVLFVIGLGALAVLGDGETATGEDDTSLVNGLSYFAWLLSWLGAIIGVGMGVVGIRKANQSPESR